jgi:glyoxalase superfamily protein
MSLFVDVPPESVEASLAFWAEISGAVLGKPEGDDGEFLPLEREEADACLWLQRNREGGPTCHQDLYVEDEEAVAAHAVDLGASITLRSGGLVVLTSPGGMPFCLVRHRGQHRLPQPAGPEGARCLVDQICLDIPPDRFDGEGRFWASLTGWQLTDENPDDEFARLTRPERIPFAVLLQRLDDGQPAVSAHLDLSCEDRDAVASWHESLGAQVVERCEHWTVMRDPVGMTYCNTVRRPGDV